MRRTKTWWRVLAKDGTFWLNLVVAFEQCRHVGAGRDPFLPDDCGECGMCSTPVLGGGPCPDCTELYSGYIEKANRKGA